MGGCHSGMTFAVDWVWGRSSVGTLSDGHHAAVAGSIPRYDKEFFSHSQLPVQTITVSVQPRVQSHVLTSVRTLKILLSVSEFC